MRTIYKYKLPLKAEVQEIEMPEGAEILHIAHQDSSGGACIWALVDTEEPMVKHKYKIFGTGHEFDIDGEDWMHVATYQVGAFVWHVFEIDG